MSIIRSQRSIHFNWRWLILPILAISTLSLKSLDNARAQQPREGQVTGQNPKSEDGQTIRVGTQLVNVLFSVTDKQNRYVSDLMKSEVAILENGKPQEIFTFKREIDLPLKIAILVDISNSTLPVLPRLTAASSRFIDSVMRPGKDTTAIIQFNSETVLIRDLTSDITRLRGGLRDIVTNALPPRRADGVLPPPVTNGTQLGGTSIYDSIIATCDDLLLAESGRKTIILFTDGYDTTSHQKRSDAIDEALRAETVIYAIGVGNLEINKNELNKICEPTGGRTFIPKDSESLDRAFAELEQELRQQYLLAYEPANDTADSSFRKIEVRVPNRKGIRVRHRLGYYALRK